MSRRPRKPDERKKDGARPRDGADAKRGVKPGGEPGAASGKDVPRKFSHKDIKKYLPGVLKGARERLKPAKSPYPELFQPAKPIIPSYDWPQEDPTRAPAMTLSQLDPTLPLAMFPVRLETRFHDRGGKHYLRVRFMPDEIMLDSLDRALTDVEREAGEAVAKQLAREGDDRSELDAMWRVLSEKVEPRRLAFATRQARAQAKDRKPPELAYSPDGRTHAPLLPDRWFVSAMLNDAYVARASSTLVDPKIAFSPDFEDPDALADAASDKSLAWLYDFDAAKDAGMALEMRLPVQARNHIDRLYAFGVRIDGGRGATREYDPKEEADRLDYLLAGRHYDHGGGFVPQGVPTNNTDGQSAGWSPEGAEAMEVLNREFPDPEAPPMESAPPRPGGRDLGLWPTGTLVSDDPRVANADRLISAFGLKSGCSVLHHFEAAKGAEEAAMAAMNRALWPVTMGEVFGTLLAQPPEGLFGTAIEQFVANFFRNNLRGGANLPALRLGPTPYGVLPISRYTPRIIAPWLRSPGGNPEHQLKLVVESLVPKWSQSAANVLRLAEKHPAGELLDEPGMRLIEILRQGPHPGTYQTATLESAKTGIEQAYRANRIALTDIEDSPLLRAVFTITDEDGIESYIIDGLENTDEDIITWPAKFDSYREMEDFLSARMALLESVQTDDPLPPFDGSIWGLAFAFAVRDQNGAALTEMIELYGEVLRSLRDHKARAFSMTPFSGGGQLGNAVLGAGSTDPLFSYLMHGVTQTHWPRADLVVAQLGGAQQEGAQAEPISTQTYISYLADLAEHHATGAGETPLPPDFPLGRKPLAYHLLRESVERTATGRETPVMVLSDIIYEFQMVRASGNALLAQSLSAPQMTQISDLISDLMSATPPSPNPAAPQAGAPTGPASAAPPQAQMLTADIGRVLLGQGTQSLMESGTALLEMAQSNPGSTFPTAQVQMLGDQLITLGKGDLRRLSPGLFAQEPSRQNELTRLAAALRLLADLEPRQIELLMSQTLGLAGWRLDAWLTALSLDRLERLRATKNKREGLRIGAYGWVEGLDRAPGARGRSRGFIPTPSLAHAKTAAVLRAAYQAYGEGAQAAPFEIDLSSRRMRSARSLFDAVRQGQDIGAALGQLFETALRDSPKGAGWVLPIRRALAAEMGISADRSRLTVDGLELDRVAEGTRPRTNPVPQVWRDFSERAAQEYEIMLQEAGLSAAVDWSHTNPAFAALDEAVDALADASLADSIHALVQGNATRAGAVLSAIQTGDAVAPELQVLDTPLAATALTHTVIAVLPNVVAPKSWTSPAACADPALDRLCTDLIAGLGAIKFDWSVEDTDGNRLDSGKTSWPEVAEQMLLAPIDLLRAEIAREDGMIRWVRAALIDGNYAPKDAGRIVVAVRGGPERARDLRLALEGWGSVLLQGRSFNAEDIPRPDALVSASAALGDIEQRAEDVLKSTKAALDEIAQISALGVDDVDPSKELPEAVIDALRYLARAGMSAAQIDRTGREWTIAHVRGLAQPLAEMTKKIAALPQTPPGDPAARIAHARAGLRACLGTSQPCALGWRWDGIAGDMDSFAQSKQRVGDDGGASVNRWLERMAPTDAPLARLARTLSIAEMTQDASPGFAVSQWPEPSVTRWIAMDKVIISETSPRNSILALAPISRPDLTRQSELTAIVIANVQDRIPHKDHTIGTALHFDAPNGEAPQVVLLAASPDDAEGWGFEALVDTLHSAFELGRIRAVDGSSLSDMNQILPGIFGPPGLTHWGGEQE